MFQQFLQDQIPALSASAGWGSLCPQVKTELNGRELKVKEPCTNFRVPEAPHGSPGIINKGNMLEPELQSKQLQEHAVCSASLGFLESD